MWWFERFDIYFVQQMCNRANSRIATYMIYEISCKQIMLQILFNLNIELFNRKNGKE